MKVQYEQNSPPELLQISHFPTGVWKHRFLSALNGCWARSLSARHFEWKKYAEGDIDLFCMAFLTEYR